jgi:CubicO group peptidase (beta-lactamase class C family)
VACELTRGTGFDPRRLGRVDDFLQRLTSSGRIPGWSMAIRRRSVPAYTSTGGCRDVAAGMPVEPGTLFRIYSMTKPVTAVAAMILYERGDIGLSDPVGRFIPAFGRMRVFHRRLGPAAGDRASHQADHAVASAYPHGGPDVRISPRPPS